MGSANYIQFMDNEGKVYGNKQVDGKLRVSSMPYLFDIAEGNVSGHTCWNKLGFNGDIDNTDEDVWEVGGTYVFPTSGLTMEIVSSSAEDTNTGSGIQKVKIFYLTDNFTEKVEEVSMSGTTVITTAGSDIYRVNYFEASQVGVNGVAAGSIDLRNTTDTPVYARINQGYTRSRQAIYTIPKDKTLYIYQVNFGAIAAGTQGCRFTTRAKYDNLVGSAVNFFLPYSEVGVQNGSFELDLKQPTKLPAGVDLKVSAIGTSASANINATVALRGWLE